MVVCMNGWIDVCIYRWMEVWSDVGINVQVDGCIKACIGGREKPDVDDEVSIGVVDKNSTLWIRYVCMDIWVDVCIGVWINRCIKICIDGREKERRLVLMRKEAFVMGVLLLSTVGKEMYYWIDRVGWNFGFGCWSWNRSSNQRSNSYKFFYIVL